MLQCMSLGLGAQGGKRSLRRWLCTDAETSTLPSGPYFPARSAVTGQRANDSPSTYASRCAACFSRQVQSHIPSGTHTKPHMRLRFARLRFRGLAPHEKGHGHVELHCCPIHAVYAVWNTAHIHSVLHTACPIHALHTETSRHPLSRETEPRRLRRPRRLHTTGPCGQAKRTGRSSLCPSAPHACAALRDLPSLPPPPDGDTQLRWCSCA
jgi:hypothetical protein